MKVTSRRVLLVLGLAMLAIAFGGFALRVRQDNLDEDGSKPSQAVLVGELIFQGPNAEELDRPPKKSEASSPIRAALHPGADIRERDGEIRGRLTLNGAGYQGTVSWYGANLSGQDRTDGSGRYVLRGVEAGIVELSVVPEPFEGFHALRQEGIGNTQVNVLAGTTTVHDLDVVVPVTTIEGRVREESGVELSSVEVRLQGGAEENVFVATTTSLDGEFRFDVPLLSVLPVAYRVVVSRGGESYSRDQVSPGESGIEFVLAPIGTVHVRAIDAETNRPLSRIDVRWRKSGEERFTGAWPRQSHSLEGLRIELTPGSYDLVVNDWVDPHIPAVVRNVSVSLSEQAEISVRLERGCVLELSLAPGAERPSGSELIALVEEELLAHVVEGVNAFGGRQFVGLGEAAAIDGQARAVRFDFHGRCTLRGLPPGRLRWKTHPDVLEVVPSFVDLPYVQAGALEIAILRH